MQFALAFSITLFLKTVTPPPGTVTTLKEKYMILEWFKSKINQYKTTEKENRMSENSYKARKHALLALSYWKECNEEIDIHIQIEGSSIYVRLGK